jgi:hypothetical protein
MVPIPTRLDASAASSSATSVARSGRYASASIRRTTSDSAYTTETLEEAPIVCQHVWERHAEGTGCDTEDCGELRSGLVMQCAICRVERCRRYVSIRN